MKRRDFLRSGIRAVLGGTLSCAPPSRIAARDVDPRKGVAGTACPYEANLAILNATILTLESEPPQVSAALIRNGRIVLLGDNGVVRSAAGSARVYDCGGCVVIPGFVDAHVHLECLANYSAYQADVHTPPMRSLDRIKVAVRLQADKTPRGRWVVARGSYSMNHFVAEKRLLLKEDLDEITDSHPVAVFSGLHVVMLNSHALRQLHLWSREEEKKLRWRNGAPRVGTLVHRNAAGEPTGIVTEAIDLVFGDHVQTIDETVNAINLWSSRAFVSKGVTSVATIPLCSDDIVALHRLNSAGALNLRVRYYPVVPWQMSIENVVDSGLASGFGSDVLKFGGVKIFVDGNGGDGVDTEYDDLKWTQSELTRTVTLAQRAGLQCIMHCVRHTALGMAINAVEDAQRAAPSNLRHRVEHVDFLSDPVEIARVKRLGMRTAQTRATRAEGPPEPSNYRRQVDLGMDPIATSDATGTIPAFSPIWGIASLVAKPEDGGVQVPSEALTFDEALRTWTLWAARGLHEEDIKGSIAVGKFGDFTVLSDDPRLLKGAALFDMQVNATIIGGRVVYERT